MNGNNYLFISTIHEQRLADVEQMARAYPLPRLGGLGSALVRFVRAVRRLTAQGLRGSAALLGWLANLLDARPQALS
ncbi:hypothetical protein ABN034_16895 [Actinopolymorpha sp. B11F2]|uniref:hypothetical protein n=1 Tax=Actinopolymorpha sp. B11F2 TaxID=3160862 RepID=UPI0032E49A0F